MRALVFLLFCLIPFPALAEDRIEVDVELVLAVDVSRSMQPFELAIQRRGYAEALTSDEVWQAIQTGLLQTIAIQYTEWAGHGMQRVILPWTIVETREDLDFIANWIVSHAEPGLRRTSISSVLDHSRVSIENNEYMGLRRVIDVSGDGPNNSGTPVLGARDRALKAGITINGLPLMTYDANAPYARWGIPDLDDYYENCVIGGIGAFSIPVHSWEEFPAAVRRKLVLEIAGLPLERIWRAQATSYNCMVGEDLWIKNSVLFYGP
jgi:hypothetical protein